MKKKPPPPEPFDFHTIAAHQMNAPIAAVSTILDVLLGEYAGPISPKQRDMLERANTRCQEALASLRKLLEIAAAARESGRGASDVAAIARQVGTRFAPEASQHSIELTLQTGEGPAPAQGAAPALSEMLAALVSNAIKYTPDHGRVVISIGPGESKETVSISVADSGVGIPESDWDNVFLPFYRTSGARGSARPGIGLGLAFVKSVVESCGGTVQVRKSALGGAEFVVQLPRAEAAEAEAAAAEARKARAFKVVVIGGVTAGPKVASKIIRLRPDAEVTVVEKGEFLSYAGCGLPYYVSGVVKEPLELMSTAVGVLRDPVFFQKVKNVRVLNRTEALEIDRARKRVRIRRIPGGEESWLDYDKLVICTGAVPDVPPLPGVGLGNVFTLHGVKDAEGIRAALAEGKARDVVIVGGGLIGVEMTEALVSRGARVTIVEKLPQILGMLDWEMARLVELSMEAHGVKVLTGVAVQSLEGTDRVNVVVTDAGSIPADMVILGTGVKANVQLARAAGLAIGPARAIKVDEHMRTSDPDIYAAGDCVECTDIITGRPCYVPLGSTANKQGRVAAINVCGGSEVFRGILGSTICKVFDYAVARTGLTESAARKLGYDAVASLAPAPDRAEYMPSAKLILLKLVADRRSRRLLGAQAVGPGGCDKRVDIAAMAITAGMTVDQLANADLCYAPPYSPAMDNIITAANVARNKMDGLMEGVSPVEVHRMLEEKSDFVFLDVRTPGEVEKVKLPHSVNIPLGSLRGRLDELPEDKLIVSFCSVSLRAYEAALILRAAGRRNVRVMDGGIAMWPYERLQ